MMLSYHCIYFFEHKKGGGGRKEPYDSQQTSSGVDGTVSVSVSMTSGVSTGVFLMRSSTQNVQF